jgi:hypothetical protein
MSSIRFHLSSEASKRIRNRLKNDQILINSCPATEEKIATEAQSILNTKGKFPDGCSDGRAVNIWLNRKNGKEFLVFKTLCDIVGEDWLEVFDRSRFTDLLVGEQRKLLDSFLNLLFNEFTSSSEEIRSFRYRYNSQIEEILSSNQIENEKITNIISIFFREYAHNGRQISFTVTSSQISYSIISFEIKGKNQNDKLESRRFQYKKPYTKIIEIENWWWKGEVDIKFEFLNENKKISRSCKAIISQRGYIWADVTFDIESNICSVK